MGGIALDALRTLPSLEVEVEGDGIERAMRAARLLTGRVNMASPSLKWAGDRTEAKESRRLRSSCIVAQLWQAIDPHSNINIDLLRLYYRYETAT